jgi:homoserine dehydrogenase
MTRRVRIALLGYGGVGRAFATACERQAPTIRAHDGVVPELVLVRRSTMEAAPVADRPAEDWRWTPCTDLSTSLHATGVEIVVQAVPGGATSATSARDDVLAALGAGTHVVTATKSHLVAHWAELDTAARSASRAIRVSAAAGAGLPAVDLARRGVRGFGCVRIRGSLNGTSNVVLEHMADGMTLADAIAHAVEAGIAEPDPRGDLRGDDAAAKMAILANLAWGPPAHEARLTIEPIDEAVAPRAKEVRNYGTALRAVATATAHPRDISVELQAVAQGDPLYGLHGAEKAVEFDCGAAGSVVVSGGRSSPYAAGLAMLKDVVNLLSGDASPGF